MDIDKVSNALGSPIRYKILQLITTKGNCCSDKGSSFLKPCEGLCVFDLMKDLGLQQSKVSYHLKELGDAGLITEKDQGQFHFYCINKAAIRRYIEHLNKEFNL
ncbi:MAG: helix-turn-helix transcriptional regulator [Firmicutes bacterium]|nr:helix-turn-helix transcriptional regulator [Bacillota bacterium]